jgi:hypothetical protein
VWFRAPFASAQKGVGYISPYDQRLSNLPCTELHLIPLFFTADILVGQCLPCAIILLF